MIMRENAINVTKMLTLLLELCILVKSNL